MSSSTLSCVPPSLSVSRRAPRARAARADALSLSSSQHDIWTPRPFLQAGGFDPKSALEAANKYTNTLIVFGRSFLATPDLVRRVKDGIELNKPDRDTFYVKGPEHTEGYTDYPFAEDK